MINILFSINNLNLEHLNNLLEKEFILTFKTITWPSNLNSESGLCIDNIFLEIKLFHTKAIKLKTLFNDHYPLIFEIGQNKYLQ